jgi:sigma-B regulation protein RsbU (phosphoserine phosphatase)
MADHGSSAPRLQVIGTTGEPRVVRLDKPIFEIGRRTASDLPLTGTDISRDHATISRAGDIFTLRDRGSHGGTFVNGERTAECVLKHGDTIELGRIGGARVVFLLDAPTRTAASEIADFRTIAALLDGLRALGSSQVLEEVLELVMDSAIDVTGAERGCIMLANDAGNLEFKTGRVRGRITLSGQSFETSQKIPHDVFATGRAQILADLADRHVADQHLGTLALGIRHVLCVPLRVVRYRDVGGEAEDERPIGVLYLDSREKGRLLSAATRDTLEAVAVQASLAIDSARLYRDATEKRKLERELQVAAEIQRALLPAAREAGAHFDIVAASLPCRAIGGDFFDYFQLANGDFGFALGDVAGKGPAAALLTAMIQGIFTALVHVTPSPAAMMARINEGLLRRSTQSRFVTLVYGRLAPDGRLTYSNGGHNPPMLVRADGVQRLETGGTILGLFPHATHAEETLTLAPGETLVVFSDGVTEALSAAGEEFGETRVLACLETHRQQPPAELLDALLAAVRAFSVGASQHDDVTALILRYQPDPVPASTQVDRTGRA